ncbi:MAG TPA: hypothetical protein VNX87_25115 [Candidatus Sulfotelmatobacter sp.]|jgi:hypothetical protein|nr:hypothetical protein [Candidatus Sulfotelmatobacter sp.]
MKSKCTFLLGGLILAAVPLALAQTGGLRLPKTVEAGSAFSIQSSGSGTAFLYIVGPGQVLRRDVQLGETTFFAPGDLHNAGRYLAVLVGGSSTENGAFDVTAAHQPMVLSFLAKPSRLPVDLHDGISGVVYAFDAFQNLVLVPTQVSFQLTSVTGAEQMRTALTRNGVAWTKMNSAAQEGVAKFVARVGDATSTRVIQQVPGNPCHLRMSARPSGQRLAVETEPVRDCNGNALPDGTIVTFTETYSEGESTVDVPLKRGVARTDMPAYSGAKVSVATGVFIGNEIHLGKK